MTKEILYVDSERIVSYLSQHEEGFVLENSKTDSSGSRSDRSSSFSAGAALVAKGEVSKTKFSGEDTLASSTIRKSYEDYAVTKLVKLVNDQTVALRNSEMDILLVSADEVIDFSSDLDSFMNFMDIWAPQYQDNTDQRILQMKNNKKLTKSMKTILTTLFGYNKMYLLAVNKESEFIGLVKPEFMRMSPQQYSLVYPCSSHWDVIYLEASNSATSIEADFKTQSLKVLLDINRVFQGVKSSMINEGRSTPIVPVAIYREF